MTILEYFDYGNYEHLRAFKALNESGGWPEEYWEEIKDLKFPVNWQINIIVEMGQIYLNTTINAMSIGKEE